MATAVKGERHCDGSGAVVILLMSALSIQLAAVVMSDQRRRPGSTRPIAGVPAHSRQKKQTVDPTRPLLPTVARAKDSSRPDGVPGRDRRASAFDAPMLPPSTLVRLYGRVERRRTGRYNQALPGLIALGRPQPRLDGTGPGRAVSPPDARVETVPFRYFSSAFSDVDLTSSRPAVRLRRTHP